MKGMKGVVLFVAGLIVGVAVQAGLAQNRNVVMMNHVGINVPDMNQAIEYYTQKMGYREAFRATDAKGQPTLVYLHVSRNTFLELGPANAERPAGFTHYGLHVEDIKSAVETFRKQGLKVSDVNKSTSTNALLANITDPYMGRIELAELTADSLHRKALDSYK